MSNSWRISFTRASQHSFALGSHAHPCKSRFCARFAPLSSPFPPFRRATTGAQFLTGVCKFEERASAAVFTSLLGTEAKFGLTAHLTSNSQRESPLLFSLLSECTSARLSGTPSVCPQSITQHNQFVMRLGRRRRLDAQKRRQDFQS